MPKRLIEEWKGGALNRSPATRGLVRTRPYRYLKSVYGWLKHEILNPTTLPLKHKLTMWQRGFFAQSAAIYDLGRNDPSNYLSDFARAVRWRQINAHTEIFDHKLALRSFLLDRGFRQAGLVAVVFQGRIVSDPCAEDSRDVEPNELIDRLLTRRESFIVKPEDGASGRDVFLVEHRDDRLISRRGMEARPFDLGDLLRRSVSPKGARMTLIEERLEQGAYWRSLFPDSGNTLRLLTLWTPGEPEPFIARAVQRIGTRDTVPTDNWSGGGISAPVDLVSGRVGPGRVHPRKGKDGSGTESFTHHPDTGAPIAGTVLPHWGKVTDTVLRAAASLPFNRVAGWDVLVTDDGEPVIIEGNGNSDIDLFQVHWGLLADPRVRRFDRSFGA